MAASAAVSHSDPRSQPMRAGSGSADEHERIDHECNERLLIFQAMCRHLALSTTNSTLSLDTKSRKNEKVEDTTQPSIITNEMDQTSSKPSFENDKSETTQPDSKELPSKEDAIEYPPPAQAALVMLALLLALFLTAIVRTNPHAHRIIIGL
jgi:hypothetical protein